LKTQSFPRPLDCGAFVAFAHDHRMTRCSTPLQYRKRFKQVQMTLFVGEAAYHQQ